LTAKHEGEGLAHDLAWMFLSNPASLTTPTARAGLLGELVARAVAGEGVAVGDGAVSRCSGVRTWRMARGDAGGREVVK